MVDKWKDFRFIMLMAGILFGASIIVEFLVLLILIKCKIIDISEIQNVLWPLNAMISFITLVAGRFLKYNEQRINGDVKLIENFMNFSKIAHGRSSGAGGVGLSEQIAAIYAVAELGKRHSLLKNIAKEGLTSISTWEEKDVIEQTEKDVIEQTEKDVIEQTEKDVIEPIKRDKIKEIKAKAVAALKYLDSN